MALITCDEFLKALTIQEEIVELSTLNDAQIKIRDLSIEEDEQIKQIQAKVRNKEAEAIELIKQTCKFAMVEPPFTDELYNKLAKKASPVILEIYLKVQEIGLTEEQKEIFRKSFIEQSEKVVEELEKVEKKKKSGKDLSSN